MSKTMKRVSALLLAILMIVTYMPMMQETAYAAKKAKKPAKVKGLKATVKKNTKKIVLSWKKAKNAKKYLVTIKDNSTKLSATKTTKKKKLTITGQWSTKYTIKVQGVNGKKKGSAAKKTVKIGANPKAASAADVKKAQAEAEQAKKDLEAALAKAAESEAAAAKLEKQLADAQKAIDTAKDIAASNQNAVAASKEAIEAAKTALEELKAAKEAWDAMEDADKEAVKAANADLYNALEGISQDDIDAAEQAIEDAEEAIALAVSDSLELESWNPEVKNAINDMIVANAGKENKYVVFDFDNTCSIFDVEEQLAVYQLQVMAFDESITVDRLKEVLATELNEEYFTKPAPASGDYCANANATYQDWIDDIAAAYGKLLAKYGPFHPEGLSEEKQAEIQAEDDWKEFATKMRAMYDCVFDSESAAVAYPWVLYWFTGMTHEEVYNLAYASHSYYKAVESSYETWKTAGTGSKIGAVEYEWTSGTAVSDNIKELMAALDNNGIDVWICSASATDPIRAAIDVWGLHDHVTGMMAMTNVYDGAFDNEYDYESGHAWMPVKGETGHAAWDEGTVATKAQTQGKGKVTAIQNVCGKEYGCGPIAGFMDSTGDYNFCTEFEDLEVVLCFNRASRKVTDGGGVIAEVAVYEADTLGYDYKKAQEAGDTLYVLQGREENGLRGLRPERETMRLGKSETILFRNDDNYTQLQYMIDNKMKVADAIDQFAIKRAAGEPGNPFDFKIGFLGEYSGYHSQTGTDMGLLKHKDWNPEVRRGLNELIKANANDGKYVVFDFDNTCSIFDVEEQLAIYQLETMSFAETLSSKKLEACLKTGLNSKYFSEPAPASGDYCSNPDATYQDWIDDIIDAYSPLISKYGITPAGITDEAKLAELHADPLWKEFATKMRAMYDCVFDSESADVAYPWVLYWFTGMTEDEVYDLATRSHSFYKEVESEYRTWSTDGAGSRIGAVEYEYTYGTQVSENIQELWKAFDKNGIDVWICSASATDPIRAAIDVWGGHDYITGLLAMTNKLESGKYINEYDYDTGYAWYPNDSNENHGWKKGDVATEAQTQGKGKVTAIQNVCGTEYGEGPIAGFMDSTGDYNFCTEFDSLQLVTCFNRASRKVTDGGGVIAEVAVYEADTLGYDFAKAQKAGDTLYLLQGREENGLRGFRPERETLRLGKSSTLLFRNDDNFTQLQYMIDNKMKVADAIDLFAIKMAAGDAGNPFDFKIGFLKEYSGYHSQGAEAQTLLTHKDWNPEVKRALNDMIKANANDDQYVVFDFDNTCSIFDVEEQLAIYQLQTMAFDETVTADTLQGILETELNPNYMTNPAPASGDYCENKDASYRDWIADITDAFRNLDSIYDFTPAGLTAEQQAEIQKTDDWKEFATKMRAMYDCVFDSESAAVAYPWVLYWFTGMTEEEVYQLAYRSHSYYKEQESEYVTWNTPAKSAGEGSRIGAVEYEWTSGTQVSENIVELWKALDDNGIDVWICSASATDPIRAAIDVWGGHDYITGMMAMTNKLEDGKYINEYDWDGGYAWLPDDGDENHGWTKDTVKQKTQTQGKGKVIAIQNVLYPKYEDHGPIAGFMDSTGDYNFCTEFETLQVVCCFNRASRKVTDGGGVIAELACYQADDLGYDFAKARDEGDTLYVLQGREENGLRGFRPERETLRLGKDSTLLFRNDDNFAQLQYMKDNKMTTAEVVDQFAIKTAADAPNNKLGFKYGFVTGEYNEKFKANDFDGYHSQD